MVKVRISFLKQPANYDFGEGLEIELLVMQRIDRVHARRFQGGEEA
jgi:hypothetical protein